MYCELKYMQENWTYFECVTIAVLDVMTGCKLPYETIFSDFCNLYFGSYGFVLDTK